MRGAPPVQMACGRDAAWSSFVALVAASAMASLGGWLAWSGPLPVPVAWAVTLAAALCVGMLVWWHADRAPAARLAWDGQAWQLEGASGELAVMIDTGGWMLLRWRGGNGVRWLPLAPRRCGAPAHLARAAVHAHAGVKALRGAAAAQPHG